MKKYLLIGALGIASLAFSQNYPSQYGNQGYGNQGGYSQSGYGNDGYYDDDFNNYAYSNFPDDYYYEYPSNYYPSAYYQNYYNDYRKSIVGIDWQRLAMEYRLSNYQMQQLMALNGRFGSFSSWNSYYGMNPDRWYYDRFYALQRILGPQIFVVIQNRYYGGYSPVHYFENYRRTYYQPRYVVVPKYRGINVVNYRIDRNRYYENRGNHYGWNNGNNGNNARNRGGFPNQSYEQNRSNPLPQRTGDGFRNGANTVHENERIQTQNSIRQSGWERQTTRNSGAEIQRVSRPDFGNGGRSQNQHTDSGSSGRASSPGMRGGSHGGFR